MSSTAQAESRTVTYHITATNSSNTYTLTFVPSDEGFKYMFQNCAKLSAAPVLPASGWGHVDEGAKTATLLEFNSHDPQGRPVDVSQRHPLFRQLDPLHDAELIGRYSDSHWVLGW